jgi:hypothetical protein
MAYLKAYKLYVVQGANVKVVYTEGVRILDQLLHLCD